MCSCSLTCPLSGPLLLFQVVANAVAALSEIAESHPNSNLLDLNPQNINKLLTALNECTEWGQIFILDCLSNYNPKDEREAQRYAHIFCRHLKQSRFIEFCYNSENLFPGLYRNCTKT